MDSFAEVLAQLEAGELQRRAQDLSQRTYFAKAHRPAAGASLDFNRPAGEVARLVRALNFGGYWNPLCAPRFATGDSVILVGGAIVVEGTGQPGVVLAVDAETVTVATAEDQPRRLVQRKLPRQLRHFSAAPEIRFAKDPDKEGTVLHLFCNDQPGLLSRVAAAIFQQGIQVHNARIATFGEKVEDTFLISDREHQPLKESAREALAKSIRKHLEL